MCPSPGDAAWGGAAGVVAADWLGDAGWSAAGGLGMWPRLWL